MNVSEKKEDFDLPINQIICGDCIDVMKSFPDDSVDLVVTDPPYNVNYEYDGYEDYLSTEEYVEWCRKWFVELKRICRGDILIFCGRNNFGNWIKEIEMPKDVFVWVAKNKRSHNFYTTFMLWEPILFFSKKEKHKMKRVMDIFLFNISAQEGVDFHSCPKPLKLFKEIIDGFSEKNDVVLDCFMGSGTTALGCIQLERNFIGIEISQDYCEKSKKRIVEWMEQKRLTTFEFR